MRLTIDNPEEPIDYTNAVRAFMQVRAANPDQKVGNVGVIPTEIDNKTYNVVRNEDSYTVRCGAMLPDETDMMEGIPI